MSNHTCRDIASALIERNASFIQPSSIEDESGKIQRAQIESVTRGKLSKISKLSNFLNNKNSKIIKKEKQKMN